MKHITLTTVDDGIFSNTSKKVTMHPEHIILIEPDGNQTYVELYGGKSFTVRETEEQIRKLIADGEAKPAQSQPEPPKP